MELLETNANPLKLFRQSKRILRNTSRAKNPDWYRRAHELDLQWHLWIGANHVVSGIFSRKTGQWFDGPAIPPLSFETDDHGLVAGLDDNSRNQLHEILRQILGAKEFGGKAKSLGIVFHLADSIRVRDLAPDFAGDTNFDVVDELLNTEPAIALGDDSIDAQEGFWHIFPLLGVSEENEKQSIAIQVSSQYKFLVDELKAYGEIRNIPVIAEVISAALESIAALPTLFPEGGKFLNSISLVQFETFSLLCATGGRGEILMLRPVPHRNANALTPNEYSELINNSAALLNLKDPSVYFVSMPERTSDELEQLLAVYRDLSPNSHIETLSAHNHPSAEGIPGNRFEFAFLTGNHEIPSENACPLLTTKEKWAIQDFCGASAAEAARMPSRGDLRLLKFSIISQKIALAAIIGFAAWTGTDFITKMRSDAWRLDPGASAEMQARLAKLQKEKKEFAHWNNLLAKRSEGWVAMETILSIFPDDGGVVLSSASYSSRVTKPEKESQNKVGFSRSWKVAGYANPKVATHIASLGSRSYIEKLLTKIAEESQADYLSLEPATRKLDVKFQSKQGTMPPSATFPAKVARHFRTAFELGIEQSNNADDELALNKD